MSKRFTRMQFSTLLFALFAALFSTQVFAQTVYQGPAGGSWFDVANWSSGLPAPGNNATVPGNTSVAIGSALTANFNIENFGTIALTAALNSSGNFANSGTFNVSGGGSVVNNGAFDNFLNASFTGTSTFTNEPGKVFTNGGTFTLATTLTNRGDVVNNGTIDASAGTILSQGTFDNRNTLNTKTLTSAPGTLFINNFGATINITGTGAVFNADGDFTNLGAINNSGEMVIRGGFNNVVSITSLVGATLRVAAGGTLLNNGTTTTRGTFTNDGTVTNNGNFFNEGTATNNAVFENNNRLENRTGATFTHNGAGAGVMNSGFGSVILNAGNFTATKPINSSGTLTNDGTFTNQSTISMGSGSVFDNNSNFINDNAGVLNTQNTATNDGTFTNRGTLNVQSGSVFTNNANLTNAISGKIVNAFELRNGPAPAVLINNGSLTNTVRMFVRNTAENNGYWLNTGDLTIEAASTLTNRAIFEQSGGNVNNLGTLANQSFFFNEDCSTVANRAGATISNTGTFENRGIVFQRGSLSGNAFTGTGGYVHTAATSAAPTLCLNKTFGADVNGVVKVDAPELVAFANFDSCQNIIYRANGVARPLFGCADVGTTKNIALSLRTRLNDSLTCTTATPIIDPLAPVFANCPPDQIIFTENNTATATWTPPTATDNCTAVTMTSSHTPGASFPVGITGVTYTATDTRANSQQCQFKISVVKRPAPPANACTGDVAGPTLTCPANISVASDFPKSRATWTEPSPVDNCLPINLGGSHLPGQEFNVGTTTVTYTARDGNGNSRTCTFTVTVSQNNVCATDVQRPVFENCPGNVFATTNATIGGNFVRWTPPGVSDNCTPATVVASHQPNSFFATGSTTVTYTATDGAGNSATCVFTVIVGADPCPGDVTGPTVSACPTNQTRPTTTSSATATWTAPTFSDACTPLTVFASHQPGATFPLGATTVVYQASDRKGNRSTCSFVITVSNPCVGDATPPVITGCPGNQTITATSAAGAVATWTAPTASDACGSVSLSASYAPGSVFPIGNTDVAYLATDAAGNTANCVFRITIQGVPGSCTSNAAPVNNSTGLNPASVALSWNSALGATAYDVFLGTANPPTTLLVANVTGTTTTATNLQQGTTYFWYVVPKNAAGPATGCQTTATSFQTSATGVLTLNCPANVVVTAAAGQNSAVVNYTAPTPTSTCPIGTTTVSRTGGLASGAAFPVGVTTVTYSATDGCANTRTCTFTVTVNAAATGVLTLNCPANVTVTAAAGQNSAVVNYTAPAGTSTCPTGTVTTTRTGGLASGAAFPIGPTVVTYSATDGCANTRTCTFTVTVNAAATGVLTLNCPANITVTAAAGQTSAVVNYTAPTGTSTCPTGTVTTTRTGGLASGAAFPIGPTVVTYSATDGCANSRTCTFTVTVNAAGGNPTCADITYAGSPNSITIGGLTAPRVAIQVFNSSWLKVFDCFDANCAKPTQVVSNLTTGTYIVKVDFYNSNYSVICSDQRNVTVGGTATNLTITCPANITVTAAAGATSAVVNYPTPTATSNCTTGSVAVTRTGGLASGAAFPLGLSSVNYQATDGCGNVRSCTFTVQVNAAATPILTLNCPTDVVVTAAPGASSAVANYTAPVGTSTCTSGTVTTNRTVGPASGSTFPLGSTLITYQASDGCGNVRTCSFNVTVNPDSGQPSCANLTYSGSSNSIAIGGLTAAHVGVQVFTSAWVPVFSCFDGTCVKPTTTVTNLATGTYIVKVDLYNSTWGTICQDQRNVTVGGTAINLNINCPANITVTAVAGATSATVNYTTPTATSNCTTGSVTVSRTAGLASGSAFPLGVSQVTYQATDGCANSRTCSFLVTVNAANPAVLTLNCPANITVTAASGATSATATYTAPVGTSTCTSGVVTTNRIVGLASGSAFPLGANTVTFQASDGCGNVRTCSFTVTVNSSGGTPNCATVTYTPGPSRITIGNLTAPNVAVQVFTSAWLPVFNCFGTACATPTLVVPSLAPGGYIVKLDFYNANFGLICSDQRNVTVTTARMMQADELVFSAFKKGQTAELKWLSTTGERNDFFVLERSADGQNFQPISMTDGKGDAHETLYFSTLDENPVDGENFYRLRLVFRDGSEVFSEMKNLRFAKTDEVMVFPNPAADKVFVSLGEHPAKNVRLAVVNQLGVVVREAAVADFEKTAELDLAGLDDGFYLLRVLREGERAVVLKLVVEQAK